MQTLIQACINSYTLNTKTMVWIKGTACKIQAFTQAMIIQAYIEMNSAVVNYRWDLQ